ncbi:hypothetical protein ACFL96_06200 [Thermoproteota archaeon]
MKEVASIKKKRICKILHCKRILSIYNPEIYCYSHQREADNKKPHQLSSVSVR